MTKAQGQGYERNMERALGIPHGSFTIDRPAGQPFLFHIPCTGGRARDPHTAILERTNMPNPERIRRVMAAIGWRMNGGHIVCPDCQAAERASKASRKAQLKTTTATAPVANIEAPKETKPMPADNVTPIAAAPQPTKDARAMRRAVLEWLEQGYDTDAGRYRPGITDATIAKETGAAEQMVGKLREEFYGDAGEPPELQEARYIIQRERQALERANTTIADKVAEAKATIERLERDIADNRRHCDKTVAQALERIEQIAKRNGWAA